MVGVYTRSYSNYRDGCYEDPTLKLTSSYVQANGVRVIGTYYLDDPRGTEGQVLIAPGVRVRGGMVRDLALIADMSNNIYAFNANPPWNLIWKQPIGNPVIGTLNLDMWGINPLWGVLSTGVINLTTNIWNIVSVSSPDGSAANATYQFHSIGLEDGRAVFQPVTLDDVTYVGPSGSTKRLGDSLRKQRAALTLVNQNGRTIVYVPFGSFAESSAANLGWIVAIDVTQAPKVVYTWATGDRYPGAGIWQAGAGLSVGDDGTLHCMTGNGGFSPPGDLGESFIKLSPSLKPLQWFSPYSDAGRAGADPTLPVPPPTKFVPMERELQHRHMVDVNNAMNAMMYADLSPTSNLHIVGDQDLGSGGALYLPKSQYPLNQNILMGGGKDGILWITNADRMGNTMPADFAPENISKNYDRLLFPPWGWTFNGMGQNLMPTNLAELPIAYNGYTVHVHGQPVAYISPDHGLLTFVQGENGPVRVVQIDADGKPTYIACGQEIASQGMKPPGGMPGGMLSLAVTAQRANTAVLWSCMPWYGNANRYVTPGRLVAYAANWVQDKTYLIKLWDSTNWGISYMHSKFTPPTCQSDKLFVPSYDGRVLIFG